MRTDFQLVSIEQHPEMAEIQSRLRRVEKRDWWLWGTAVAVMLLLALGVMALAVPVLMQDETSLLTSSLNVALPGLLGLVLLFSLFAIYQQTLIKRLRSEMAGQLAKMAALHTQAELLQKLAILDPLTGLYNQRFAAEYLPVEIARAERHQFPLTVAMLNIKGTKKTNDLHGNTVGDSVIKEFAAQLRKAVRSSDLPVRLGGDQFLVLLPECREDEVPLALSRVGGLEVDTPAGYRIPISFAAGWVQHKPGETPEQLLKRLDDALYIDKCTGGAEERVRQAEALQQQERRIKLVGRLAHEAVNDFNDALMVIQGYTAELQSSIHDDSLNHKMREIAQASERAAVLCRQLVAFGKRHVVTPEPLDWNEVLAAMEDMLRRVLGRQIELVLMPEPAVDTVLADRSQLEQIVMQFAAHAMEAMPGAGRLTIETANVELGAEYVAAHPGSRAGKFVRLAVTDSGRGFDAKTLSNIFDPLFAYKNEGQGGGLANVYGCVKQLGGYIWVDSEIDRGTTITVFLPSFSDVPGETSARPASGHSEPLAPSVAGRFPPTVLYLEPAEAVRRLMCDFLRKRGYRVLEAESGAEALQLVEEQAAPIHVAVLNSILPAMSCSEIVDHMLPMRPQVKVLYLAGSHDPDLMGGGKEVLQKPFTPDDLSRRIGELLQAHSAAAPV